MQTQIQSVVFDIGNVLVRWSPLEIIRLTFGENDDNPIMARAVFQSEIWLALNQGDITWDEAKQAYQNQFGFSDIHSAALFDYIKRTQILIHGSQALLREVKDAGYSVYALTDNVLDIVDYLKQTYDFWPLFDGEIISANEGCLKPNATIYQALTQRYQLDLTQAVFIDDVQANVAGAEAVGMQGIVFETADQCRRDLIKLGLALSEKNYE